MYLFLFVQVLLCYMSEFESLYPVCCSEAAISFICWRQKKMTIHSSCIVVFVVLRGVCNARCFMVLYSLLLPLYNFN